MLAAQRHKLIVDEVRRAGAVRVSELTELLGVSEMTIRRDLDALDERGLLSKVHGGATAAGPGATHEPGFAAKSVRQRAEKAAIAARAATLVRPGTAVALSTVLVFMISTDGRSNWLEGAQLTGAYVIMAVSFFFVEHL